MRYAKPKIKCSICGQEITRNGMKNHVRFKHPDSLAEFEKDKEKFMLPVEDKTPATIELDIPVEPIVEEVVEPVVEPVVAPAPAPIPEVTDAPAESFPEPTPEQKKRGFGFFRRRTD